MAMTTIKLAPATSTMRFMVTSDGAVCLNWLSENLPCAIEQADLASKVWFHHHTSPLSAEALNQEG